MTMNKHFLFTGVAVILAFCLGAGAMWLRYDPNGNRLVTGAKRPNVAGSDRLSQPFADPFREMDRMRERMDRLMGGTGSPDSWFADPFDRSGASAIRTEEDDESISYVIDTGDSDVVDLTVDVSDGYVELAATLEGRHDGGASTTRLSRRFPVPPGVDPASAKVEKEDGEVVVHFHKTA